MFLAATLVVWIGGDFVYRNPRNDAVKMQQNNARFVPGSVNIFK